MPYAFTEHGVLILSSVLNSQRANQVNIQIMRIYTKLRAALVDHNDILLKLERLEREVSKHGESFEAVFEHLKELINPRSEPLRRIGFKRGGEL